LSLILLASRNPSERTEEEKRESLNAQVRTKVSGDLKLLRRRRDRQEEHASLERTEKNSTCRTRKTMLPVTKRELLTIKEKEVQSESSLL
jgi:hypothetical protein